MKYNNQQLSSMANYVLVAKECNDPRYDDFMLNMVARTLMKQSQIEALITVMAKEL